MDSGVLTLVFPILVALIIAAAGYAVLGRKIETHDRTSRRVEAVAKPQSERKGRKGPVDAAGQRRRAVQDQLKELASAQKAKKPKVSLRSRLEGAGLTMTPQTFYIASGGCALALALVAFLVTKSPIVAAIVILPGGLGVPKWTLSYLRTRRQKAFIREFPNALEIIVRGVKSGLPINECLKIIASESPAPIGPEFVDVVEGGKVGVPLEQGLQKLYERMPIAEVNFFMIVLAIQQKTGGNLSEALGNLSRVLRDRKKLRMKVQAMSSEAKASAGIIGSLPIFVMLGMFAMNPDYINVLFEERLGHAMLIVAGIWMSIGVAVMAKMINFKI
jgi:tight adherence protein B